MTGLALRVSVPKWNVESELGYKPITTFWGISPSLISSAMRL